MRIVVICVRMFNHNNGNKNMRFIKFFLFLCLISLALSTTSYAQDEQDAGKSELLEELMTDNEPEAPLIPPEDQAITEETETSFFKRATNTQIEEAQKFFRFCSKNDSMKARKDCKCAATKFLETRVEVGDDVTSQKIVMMNINECLLDGVEPLEQIDLSQINPKFIEEANKVYDSCKSDPYMEQIDCECYSSEFLDQRISLGPIPSKRQIESKLRGKCMDIVKQTGQEYSQCMSGTMIQYGNGDVSQKDYCECVARAMAKATQLNGGSLSYITKRNVKAKSMVECQKPENIGQQP